MLEHLDRDLSYVRQASSMRVSRFLNTGKAYVSSHIHIESTHVIVISDTKTPYRWTSHTKPLKSIPRTSQSALAKALLCYYKYTSGGDARIKCTGDKRDTSMTIYINGVQLNNKSIIYLMRKTYMTIRTRQLTIATFCINITGIVI